MRFKHAGNGNLFIYAIGFAGYANYKLLSFR